jgi:serine/threonine protein phosphatase PrpC
MTESGPEPASPPAEAAAEPRRADVRKKITLPNAAVGREYTAQVTFAAEPGAVVVADASATGLDGAGLRFDPSTCMVGGSPEKAGEFPFSFRATLEAGAAGATTIVELEGVLTVNPDPKTLWKNLPSDPNGRFVKPDDECRSMAEDGMLVVGASRRGRSHAHEGKYRDDEFGFRRAADGWWLLAVADGAGSAPFSRRGSQVAVGEALDQVEALLAEHGDSAFLEAAARMRTGDAPAKTAVTRRLYDVLVRAAYTAAAAIQTEASKANEPERDFASTLLLAIYRKIEDAHFVAAFGIGDGGIALLRLDDDEVIPLSVADSGEYAGQTRFLTPAEFASAEHAIGRLHVCCVDRFTALVLMTDGVTDPLLESDDALGDVGRWRDLWQRELSPAVTAGGDGKPVEERLLSWLDFYTPNNHDDRTLTILLPATS